MFKRRAATRRSVPVSSAFRRPRITRKIFTDEATDVPEQKTVIRRAIFSDQQSQALATIDPTSLQCIQSTDPLHVKWRAGFETDRSLHQFHCEIRIARLEKHG